MSFLYLPLLNDTLAIQLVATFYYPGPANELFLNTQAYYYTDNDDDK